MVSLFIALERFLHLQLLAFFTAAAEPVRSEVWEGILSRFWRAASSTHVLVRRTKVSPSFPNFRTCGSSGWTSVMVRP